jgi:hypothetical protein
MNGVAQGAEAVRSIVTSIRTLYDSQEFNLAGPYGGNGFLEEYTAQVRGGGQIGNVVLVIRNAAGQAQHIVANYLPRTTAALVPADRRAARRHPLRRALRDQRPRVMIPAGGLGRHRPEGPNPSRKASSVPTTNPGQTEPKEILMPDMIENSAGTTAIRPFTSPEVPEAELEALRERIAATRWPNRELVADDRRACSWRRSRNLRAIGRRITTGASARRS